MTDVEYSDMYMLVSGARSMDKHFLHAPLEKNMPVLMGLLGVWNISFMGYKTRTILPYAEALLKFPAHIQQVRTTICRAFEGFRDGLCGVGGGVEWWRVCSSSSPLRARIAMILFFLSLWLHAKYTHTRTA